MPCSGPSQDVAYKQADTALIEIKKLLKEKYLIDTELDVPYGYQPFRDDQKINLIILEDLLKEIFWTDACLSF